MVLTGRELVDVLLWCAVEKIEEATRKWEMCSSIENREKRVRREIVLM